MGNYPLQRLYILFSSWSCLNVPTRSNRTELEGGSYLDELSMQLSIANRKNHETPLSVALLDVDPFFRINEESMHFGVDNAISRFADVIREVAGEGVSAAG